MRQAWCTAGASREWVTGKTLIPACGKGGYKFAVTGPESCIIAAFCSEARKDFLLKSSALT